jgi:hypothetical protein
MGPSPSNIDRALDDHMEFLKTKIKREASSIAQSKDQNVGLSDIAEAVSRYAPGVPISTDRRKDDISFRRRFGAALTPVTVVSAFLAVVFGGIGLAIVLWGGDNGSVQYSQGAFDIAKIFAGAIVGSTGASIATNAKL